VCSIHFETNDFDKGDVMFRDLMGVDQCRRGPRLNHEAVPHKNLMKTKQPRDNHTVLLDHSYNAPLHGGQGLQGTTAEGSIAEVSALGGPIAESTPVKRYRREESESCTPKSKINDFESTLMSTTVSTLNTTVSEYVPSESDVESVTSYFEDDSCSDLECESEASDFKQVLVDVKCLEKLFKFCPTCGKRVTSIQKSARGVSLIVSTKCDGGCNSKWKSQHDLPDHKSQGTLTLCSAIYLSGLSFASFQRMAGTMKLLVMSEGTYYSYCKMYIYHAIKYTWINHRKENLDNCRRRDCVRLAGDGQYDSVGHCASNLVYTIQDVDSGLLADFYVLKRNILAGDMEKNAMQMLLERLACDLGNVKLFLSDRHTGVRKLMREHFLPTFGISHQFDVWHVAKSLTKKIKANAKPNSNLFLWKNSIVNHLWWSCETCNGNDDVLVEKFTSMLHHVSDVHSWDGAEHFHQCEHPPLPQEDRSETKWIHKSSPEYAKLRTIVRDTRFLKDLRHCNKFIHTGSLESYHNLRNVYCSKRSYFSIPGTIYRTILAILDFNNNVNRPKAGTPQVHYSKASSSYVLRDTYANKNESWRHNLHNLVLQYANNNSVINVTEIEEEFTTLFPEMYNKKLIAKTPKPTLQEAMTTRRSRFQVRN
jgi:hypothetical protein